MGKAPTKQSLLDAGGKPNQTTIKKKIKTNIIHGMAGVGNDLVSHKSHGELTLSLAKFQKGGLSCCKEKNCKADKPVMCLHS